MIRCVIVDDEPLPIELIASYIEKVPYLQLVHSFADAINASDYLRRFPVDLLFLDIEMPQINGMQLYQSLTKPPLVIFTTAYSSYAVKGFEVDAVDYLLKPFSFERFQKAAEKARKLLDTANAPVPLNTDFIMVKSDYQTVKVNIVDILYIEGLDDYIKIYSRHGLIVTLMSLKAIHELLPDEEFVRVHRSFIVPISKIRMITKRSVTIDEKEIPLGNTYAQAFLNRIENRKK
jgi:DNA-binding LytR/AlgR family response regulator